jgi:hypothetical protein
MTYSDKKMIQSTKVQVYCRAYIHSLPYEQNKILACYYKDVTWKKNYQLTNNNATRLYHVLVRM